MIYPDNFENKIGFDDIRRLLKGRCVSSLGTAWVDTKVHFMTQHSDVVKALQEYTEYGLLMEEYGDDFEANFFDVREPLIRLRAERTYMEEPQLFDLKRSLQTANYLMKIIGSANSGDSDEDTAGNEEEHRYPALWKRTENIDTFPEIVNRIDAILNKYGKVKDTASPELLSTRHQLEVTTRSIGHSLRSIIAEAQNEGYIERDVSPTLRDGRLMIPVAPALKRKIRGIVHDESATGKTVFIEPAAVVEANNRIRELKAAERREIIRILQETASLIRPHISEILEAIQFLAYADYLNALKSFSETTGGIVPQVSKGPVIDWRQAYHPLLKLSLERHGRKMVPLDISLKTEQYILLISGPNAGGKSVCLKTAGLLQYMLQCGMPVPTGENSSPGIFKDIFIDIGDEQSITDDLSTYSGHLLRMKHMMKHCSSSSLLLIDEFGSGTEPQIGGALAEGILDHFVTAGAHGIITTHYQNLKLYAQRQKSIVNGAMLYDRHQMQPLFMLQIGNPGSSFAIEMARKIGLPRKVIDYASEIVGKDYVMSDKYLQDIVRDKRYWEDKRQRISKRERQLEDTVAKYEKELAEVEGERRAILTKAKNDAGSLIKEANAKIENTIRAIKEAQAERERTLESRNELSEFKATIDSKDIKADHITRKMEAVRRRQERRQQAKGNRGKATPPAVNALSALVSSLKATPKTSVPKEKRIFKKGDYVCIKGQTTPGRIENINGSQANVLFGMMHATLALNRLEAAPAPKEDKIRQVATFVSKATRDAIYEKKLHFKPEIDLRGMRADEALTAIAYFIDDAIQLEQPLARILHGTGTGALRELVRRYLGTVNGVKRFHDEHVQFGGAGITVVEFN